MWSRLVKDVANLHTKSTRDAHKRGNRRIRAAVFDVDKMLGAEPCLLGGLLLGEALLDAKLPDAVSQVREYLDGLWVRPGF